MSKIDTSEWRKFKVSDLFTSEAGDVDLQQKDVNGKGVALVSSGESNTGVIGNTDRPAKVISADTITVDMFGSVQYRDFQYKMVTHARVFALIPKEPINREVGLYLVSVLKKLTTEFSYNNMCSWNKIKDMELLLPAVDEDVPDWDYMQERIAELEQEHIVELEQECIAELDRYLAVTGLDGYTLTDEDLKTLSYSGSGRDEVGVGPADAGVRKEMREFKISSVFSLCKGQRLTKADQLPGDTPFIGSTESNNGVTGYIGQKPIFKENAITVSYNGSVGQVFYQEQPFWASDDINVLYLKGHTLDRELFGYLGASLYRAGKSFSYTFKWNLERMRDTMFTLPIQTDATGQPVVDSSRTYHPEGYVPDWDYMVAYIRAIEKLVIQDVVDFKDEFIAKARAIVGAGKEAR